MRVSEISVLIVDENRLRASIIEAGLVEAGYRCVAVLSETDDLVNHIKSTSPDVIVIDLENPGRDRLEAMFQLSRAVKKPIAMFVDQADQASIEEAVSAGVSAYVVDGLRKERVRPIMDTAISRFNAFSRMERELEEAKNELAGRRVIDKAKSILMRSKGLAEEEAYRLLRKAAMNQNRKIHEIAQSVISAASILGDEGADDGI